MLTEDQSNQFQEILEELGKTLDITENQHDQAVKSYEFVANHLAAPDSSLARYNPEILPQGSFMLGTMIKPIGKDELDIDLVCRLEGKQADWTQRDVKQIVGDRLKSNGIIKKLLEVPDGRRCWTLDYESQFHMDVLPAIVSTDYKVLLEKAFSAVDRQDLDKIAIRITDKELLNYNVSVLPDEWLKSNPFGYGVWFAERASLSVRKALLMSESVKPVPRYQENKLPLQRVVQILKRHRDMMFNGDEHKPISIIITTLAARAYDKQTDIPRALLNIIEQIPNHIEERYSAEHGRVIKWIPNPVNAEENFADKWPEEPIKERNFYTWLNRVRVDVLDATGKRGISSIQESLSKSFGEDVVTKTFSNYGDRILQKRQSGGLRMATGLGTLGDSGSKVGNHNFHGED